MIFRFFIYLLLLGSFLGFAKTITLASALDYAKKGLSYKEVLAKKIMAKSARDKYSFYYYPSLDLKLALPKITKNLDQGEYNTSYSSSFALNQSLPLDFNFYLTKENNLFYNDSKLENSGNSISLGLGTKFYYGYNPFLTYREIENNLKQAELALLKSENDFYEAVFKNFIDLYLLQEQSQIELKSFNLAKKNFEEGKRKFQIGIIPEVELFELELYFKKKDLALRKILLNLEKQKENFKIFINYKKNDAIVLVYDRLSVKKHIFNAKEQTLLFEKSLAYFSAEQQILTSEISLKEIYKDNFPSLDLSLSYSNNAVHDKIDLLNYENGEKELFFTANLNIPIFNKFSSMNSLDMAKFNLSYSKKNLANTRRKLLADYKSLREELSLDYESLKISRESFELAKKIYEISQKRFENGLITSKNLIENQMSLASSEHSLISNEINYLRSLISYKSFVGYSLEEFFKEINI